MLDPAPRWPDRLALSEESTCGRWISPCAGRLFSWILKVILPTRSSRQPASFTKLRWSLVTAASAAAAFSPAPATTAAVTAAPAAIVFETLRFMVVFPSQPIPYGMSALEMPLWRERLETMNHR